MSWVVVLRGLGSAKYVNLVLYPPYGWFAAKKLDLKPLKTDGSRFVGQWYVSDDVPGGVQVDHDKYFHLNLI